VEVIACKPAEDGSGYIVRLADVHGRGGMATLLWAGVPFAVQVAPFEVVTLRLLPEGNTWRMEICDLLERPA
jgi:hypothetical protein